jgi:hypothetical protein
MLSFLPFLGPIFQAVASVFKSFASVDIAKVKADATVTVAETQAATQIIHDTHDDWGVRLARDVVMWPWCLWLGGYGWDTFVADRWPWLMIHIADAPAAVAYIPYAVMIFLFGNIGLNMWRRLRG